MHSKEFTFPIKFRGCQHGTRAIHHECLLVFQVSYDVSYDTGDKSIQCGRLNDVLKLWLMWKQKVGGSS